MANRRKNIPKDLLTQLIEESRGILGEVRRKLMPHGYHCDLQTIKRYIEEYDLEELMEQHRYFLAETAVVSLREKAEEGESWAVNTILNTIGHYIKWKPNETKLRTEKEIMGEIDNSSDVVDEILQEIDGKTRKLHKK